MGGGRQETVKHAHGWEIETGEHCTVWMNGVCDENERGTEAMPISTKMPHSEANTEREIALAIR